MEGAAGAQGPARERREDAGRSPSTAEPGGKPEPPEAGRGGASPGLAVRRRRAGHLTLAFIRASSDQGPRGFYPPLSPGPWGRGAEDPGSPLPATATAAAGPFLLAPAPPVAPRSSTHTRPQPASLRGDFSRPGASQTLPGPRGRAHS